MTCCRANKVSATAHTLGCLIDNDESRTATIRADLRRRREAREREESSEMQATTYGATSAEPSKESADDRM